MGKLVTIKNARISFPRLWKHGEDNKDRMGVTLILEEDAHAREFKEVAEGMKAAVADTPAFKGKAPSLDRRCLRSKGGTSWRDEYEYKEGNRLLKAGAPARPIIWNAKGQDVTTEEEVDAMFYSGCRVWAKVEIWGQSNDHGKRINAKLVMIQFCKDDDSFDGSHVSRDQAVDGFGSLDDGSDDMLGGDLSHADDLLDGEDMLGDEVDDMLGDTEEEDDLLG